MNEKEYIDGNVTTLVKEQYESNIMHMVNELRDEGFFDEQIYDYLNDIIIQLMHGKKYSDINDMLRKEREEFIKNNTK
mgnify:CR=1 FL=1|jgi:hypothetical protein|tara:strand:- start:173 stop:406 length:234 start_codon:yes stop_codon:yes gene_type:complete